jgi:hypothetical protein
MIAVMMMIMLWSTDDGHFLSKQWLMQHRKITSFDGCD